MNDPLLDGYFAVIMPDGRFPPPMSETVGGKDPETVEGGSR